LSVAKSLSLPFSHFITLPSGKVPATTAPPKACASEVTTSALVSAKTVTFPP
jgi:hypothetical protein